MELRIMVHGRGNAWPVLLGEEHPFYSREDYRDLSNAAYSLRTFDNAELTGNVLIDAGHGTIQSLISGDNRIPDCICLTHGHMDHTLSVDWVVQSFWRKHQREKQYPIYATLPVYEFMIRTFPHLESLVDFKCLEFGKTICLSEAPHIKLTPFPVYHGSSAAGASMLLFESEGRKILFTGDLLYPSLKEEDYSFLTEPDFLVVDCNNRFPWPRTNHWSFAGSVADVLSRNEVLEEFFRDSGELCKPLTILEFLEKIHPQNTVLVHYSGVEDKLYHGEEQLDAKDLQEWASVIAGDAGINSKIIVPEAGEEIII